MVITVEMVKMISESELKELSARFDTLKIASGLKCPDCGSHLKMYLDTVYLHNLKVIPIENDKFLNCLLNDLEIHIRENHPDRAKYFLDRIFKGEK